MAFKGKDSCYDKAAPDEPIFTLRAKDRLAPAIVRIWAQDAKLAGAPASKVEEAIACARAMTEWAAKHGSKTPD